jgi:predicted nuclease of predicted toxin-antitoxin system
MQFLLDQGIPRSAVDGLLARGFHAEHVGQLGMSMDTDEELLEAAANRDAIIVTLDADFHTLLATTHATLPSVIRIRIEGLKGEDVADLIAQVAAAAEPELEAGAAVSVTMSGVRVRLLPLV